MDKGEKRVSCCVLLFVVNSSLTNVIISKNKNVAGALYTVTAVSTQVNCWS